MTEPRIGARDLAIWDSWRKTVSIYGRSRQHQARVDSARRVAEEWLSIAERPAVMWSAGKDSTAMAHMLVQLEPRVELVSEKDDLDYPGEREYVEALAAAWGARITVLEPDMSPAQWMEKHAHGLEIGGDLHGRAAELSKQCFYRVVESYTRGRSIALGLRSEESNGRRMNRATHGRIYTTARGQLVCQPIADWTGLDVYAYLDAHGIDLLPLYRCVALMHAREPWLIRKSWWIQGAAGARGGVMWLRHYYPSLHRRLVEWMPRAQSLGA